MAQQYQVDIVTKVSGYQNVQKLEKALAGLANDQKKVDQAARKAAAGQQQFGRAAQRAGSSAKGAATGVKALGAGFAVATAKITAIIGTVKAFTSAMGAAFERDAAEQRLKNITSSAGEYNAAIAAASQLSAKFGQTQTETTKALGDTYSRLSGLGYGLKEVTEIYDGFNTIALQSGVASEEAAGAFFQLSQALGSGVLQGDELRSILERMPQLTQMLAQQMNVTAGAIKEMGAQGQITGEVIYQALSKAAAEGGNLEGKLTSQQMAFMALNRAVNEFFVVIGRVFSPAVIAIADKFAQYMQHVNTVFQYLGQTYGPMVSAQMERLQTAMKAAFGDDYMERFMTFLQNVGLKVFGALAKAVAKVVSITAGLVEKFAEIADSPLFRLLADAWGAVADKLGLSNDRIGEFKGKQDEAAESAAGLVDQYSKLPPKIQSAKDKKEQMKDTQKELNELIKQQAKAESQSTAKIDQKLKLANAVLDKEKAISDTKLQQAEADLAAATTYQEKVNAINRIFEEQVTQAKLQYEATMAAVEAEVAKKEAALRTQMVLERQVHTAIELQRSAGIFNVHQEKAIMKAAEGVRVAQEALQAEKALAQEMEAAARARYEASVQAAETLKQQQLQELQQEKTNQKIGEGVEKMNQLASAANNAAAAAAKVGAAGNAGGGGGGGGTKRLGSKYTVWHGDQTYKKYKMDENGNIVETTEEERNREKMSAAMERMNSMANKEQIDNYLKNFDWQRHLEHGWRPPNVSSRNTTISTGAYAEGGYVTGPTNAIIGEGGDSEYVIPSGKMDEAMKRYSSGMRGSGVIPDSADVTVNYNGSTVDMGGSSYVNQGDVSGIVNQAVNATLGKLRGSSRARLNAGI